MAEGTTIRVYADGNDLEFVMTISSLLHHAVLLKNAVNSMGKRGELHHGGGSPGRPGKGEHEGQGTHYPYPQQAVLEVVKIRPEAENRRR